MCRLEAEVGKFFMTVILLLLLGATIYLLTQSKEAYKVLPDINQQMKVDPYGLWRKFDDPNYQFSVAFPVVPQHATDHVKDPATKQVRQYDMYVASQPDGALFLIRIVSYPKNVKLTHTDLMNSINYDLIQAHEGNQLLSSSDTTFDGRNAVKFTIASDPTQIEGLAFAEGTNLYLIAAMASKDLFNAADYEHFINSFHLSK